MSRRVAYLTVGVVGALVVLGGCANSILGGETRASWRNDEERACMVRREVRPSPAIQKVSRLRDKGACGIDRPLKVSGLIRGRVQVGPSATINCPMTAALEDWMTRGVQPAAMAWFGQPVVEIKQMASYACRTRNSERGAKLSEHAFGNALDVSGFKLADGRVVTVKGDWNGDMDARSFMREVFASACQTFKTVLGPGVRNHADHFHLDLAHHNATGTSRYCRPKPGAAPPRRTPYRPGLFVRSRPSQPLYTGAIANNLSDDEVRLHPLTYAPVPKWPVPEFPKGE